MVLLPALDVVPWIIKALAFMLLSCPKFGVIILFDAASTLLLAICLDRIAGEPKSFHPLVGFGNLANFIESILNVSARSNQSALLLNFNGAVAVILCTLPIVSLCAALETKISFAVILFNVLILYLCLGARSLAQHAYSVESALMHGSVVDARINVSRMVSRDTSNMSEDDIATATIESVLENGNDAIFATIFWFLVLGAPGAVLYRLANTLDAMWGYKNAKFLHFGWAAARFDDCLNWIPARITALTYSLLGDFSVAWSCWWSQASSWYSPNAGPVMAAGAGALCLQLGGPATYDGKIKHRPVLGRGPAPIADDISRAVKLVDKGIWLWLIASFAWGAFHA